MRSATMLASIAAAACFAADLLAQPGSPPPAADRPGMGMGEIARERLQRRIDSLREDIARHEHALALIDRGAKPDEIRAALRQLVPHADPGAGDDPPDAPGIGPRPGAGPGVGRGPGSRGPGPQPRGPEAEPDWPATKDRIFALIKEHNPQAHDQLREIAKARPAMIDRMFAEMAPRLRDLAGIREKDPALFAIKVDQFTTEWQMRQAMLDYARLRHNLPQGAGPRTRTLPNPPANLDEAKARVREAVALRFDLVLREKSHEIDRLGARLASIRDEVQQSGANRDAMIDERVAAALERVDRQPPRPGDPAPGRRPGGPPPDDTADPSP